MWDNFAVQHKATFDYDLPLPRLMYRTTVRGPSRRAKGEPKGQNKLSLNVPPEPQEDKRD